MKATAFLTRLAGIGALAALVAAAFGGSAIGASLEVEHRAADGIRSHEMKTANLPAPVRVLVQLPPSYGKEPARRYPVLYFLHDGQGDERVLFRRGVAAQLASGMRAGTLPEFLVVSPRGVDTWFVDSYDGRSRYETFLTDELVPFVDRSYRTLPERRARAVAGISMGGYGAIHWGLGHPGLFAVVGGLSPAVEQLDWHGVQALPFFIRPSLTRVFGRSAAKNHLRANDVYDMLLSRPESAGKVPEVLVRCGDHDKWRLGEVSAFLKKYLDALGIANEVVIEPGGHDWGYWNRALPILIADLSRRLPRSGE